MLALQTARIFRRQITGLHRLLQAQITQAPLFASRWPTLMRELRCSVLHAIRPCAATGKANAVTEANSRT
jgi:hypothetical protein